MPSLDADRTPVYFPPLDDSSHPEDEEEVAEWLRLSEIEVEEAFERITPSMPLPLTRCVARSSWEPPPLRQLLESTPPPPRLPMRSQLELDCALKTETGTHAFTWPAPAMATTANLVVDWNTSMAPAPKRRYLSWITMGAAYALGVTAVLAAVAGENERELGITATKLAHTASVNDLPTLLKTAPVEAKAATATTSAVKLKKPKQIVGYITDPPPPKKPEPASDLKPFEEPAMATFPPLKVTAPWYPRTRVPRVLATDASEAEAVEAAQDEPAREPEPQEIDLQRLRVVVGAKAAQASSCGDGLRSGSMRVSVTFAPSGHATSAVLTGGSFNGTQVGSCVAAVMRSAVIAPFKGSHTTVTKTVTIRKKR